MLHFSSFNSAAVTAEVDAVSRWHDLGSSVSLRAVRPTLRAVLMGTKSCTKILNFSTRFSCENLAVEDFVTLLMGKKSC